MNKTRVALWALALCAVAVGCQRQKQVEENRAKDNSAAHKAADKPSTANAVVDQWLGQWNGPEGTSLVLSKNGEKYVVKINSLDGPATYEGIAVGDHIEFQRDGKNESIHAGSGADTGMKWLLDEKNCLVIKASEGFCR